MWLNVYWKWSLSASCNPKIKTPKKLILSVQSSFYLFNPYIQYLLSTQCSEIHPTAACHDTAILTCQFTQHIKCAEQSLQHGGNYYANRVKSNFFWVMALSMWHFCRLNCRSHCGQHLNIGVRSSTLLFRNYYANILCSSLILLPCKQG